MLRNIRIAAIREYPLESISVLFGLMLIVIGAFLCIPAEWLGVTTAYPNQLARAVFGVLIATPAVPIVYQNAKWNVEDYRKRARQNSKWLFWMAVTYLYLAIFSVMAAGVFPPYWLLHLGAGLTVAIVWLVNRWVGQK